MRNRILFIAMCGAVAFGWYFYQRSVEHYTVSYFNTRPGKINFDKLDKSCNVDDAMDDHEVPVFNERGKHPDTWHILQQVEHTLAPKQPMAVGLKVKGRYYVFTNYSILFGPQGGVLGNGLQECRSKKDAMFVLGMYQNPETQKKLKVKWTFHIDS